MAHLFDQFWRGQLARAARYDLNGRLTGDPSGWASSPADQISRRARTPTRLASRWAMASISALDATSVLKWWGDSDQTPVVVVHTDQQ